MLFSRGITRVVTRGLATTRTNVKAVGVWGDLAKCSRAVRIGNTVHVAGTCAQGDTAREQMQNIFAIIEPALTEAGASLSDVVTTRLFAADIQNVWEELGTAHGEILGEAMPACTLVGGSLLMPWMKVEVEVTAVVSN